jgi:CheY-like chemotaxis protein
MVQTSGASRFTVLLPPEPGGWHETVTRLLEPQGVQTLTARTGREALDLIETQPLHAVVLDTQMPQLGGMQVLKLMRDKVVKFQKAQDAGPGAPKAQPTAPPTILLTSHLTSTLLREALTMHVFSVLSKPVDFNLLLDALARLLKRYHQSRWPAEG